MPSVPFVSILYAEICLCNETWKVSASRLNVKKKNGNANGSRSASIMRLVSVDWCSKAAVVLRAELPPESTKYPSDAHLLRQRPPHAYQVPTGSPRPAPWRALHGIGCCDLPLNMKHKQIKETEIAKNDIRAT